MSLEFWFRVEVGVWVRDEVGVGLDTSSEFGLGMRSLG